MQTQFTPKEIERFWSKVNTSGGPDACWPWRSRRSWSGYGRFATYKKYDQRDSPAHRVAWLLTVGPIPDGFLVCHHCDNRICCNPSHMFIGTPKDNIQDMMRKGRHGAVTKRANWHRGESWRIANRNRNTVRGERSPNTHLTTQDVLAIRTEYAAGANAKALLERFGIGKTTLYRIIRRETWAHI